VAFTKCFHNSSTIIPSTILPQANPDAPNSSKQGRVVEELKKNCGRIVERFCGSSTGSAAGKNCGRIVRVQNLSTIIPQFCPAALPDEGPQNLSTIFPQLFLAGSLP
jgi:hypothetical protein